MAQQCCPGGNRLRGYLRIYIFWLNNRYFKPKFFKKKMKKKILKTLAGFVSDLANLTENPLGGSPGGLQTISAGTSLLGHTVHPEQIDGLITHTLNVCVSLVFTVFIVHTVDFRIKSKCDLSKFSI